MRTAPRSRRRRSRRRLRVVVVTALAVLVVLAAGAGVVGAVLFGQAQDARSHLLAARDAAADMAAAVRDRSPDRVRADAESISSHVHAADDIIDGPLWQAAAAVPLVGPNVDAVRTMTRAAVVIDEKALPSGLSLLTDLSTGSLSTDGAGIDLAPFRDAATELPQISDAVGQADDLLGGIDTSRVVPEVADAADSFTAMIHGIRPTLDDLQASLPTLLDMAGANGPRRYLVIFQNNAEIRATGGNPAAQTLVTIDDGKARIESQSNSSQFDEDGLTARDVTDVPAATRALYETDTWQFSQNFTRTPDFPFTAHLFDALWAKAGRQPFDGVISLDPVALARVLAVTGPVTLPGGGEITADNAVSLLLHDAYTRFGSDAAASDAYFAQVVESVFAVLTHGSWAPVPMIEALTHDVQDHRLLAWMRDASAQAAVVRAGMSGTFAADGSDVGVFLNDSSHSKLEYFLSSSVSVTCDAATRTVHSSITMTSTAPGGLPGYVQGQRNRSMGLPGNTMLLDVLFFAPSGGQVTSTDPARGDIARWDRSGSDAGRDARSLTITLAAGETKTVSATSTYDPAVGVGAVRFTPGIGDTPVTLSPSCEPSR